MYRTAYDMRTGRRTICPQVAYSISQDLDAHVTRMLRATARGHARAHHRRRKQRLHAQALLLSARVRDHTRMH